MSDIEYLDDEKMPFINLLSGSKTFIKRPHTQDECEIVQKIIKK